MQESKQKRLINTGDIFVLGDHRLICGDSMDSNVINRLIGNEKIKAVITDPPYAIDYVQSKSGFKQKIIISKNIIGDGFKNDEEYKIYTRDWLKQLTPFMCDKNSFYIFNSDKMIFSLRQGMQDVGIYFSQLLVWIKNNSVIGRKDYLPQHELIAYGWYGKHEFVKAKDKSVIFVPKPVKNTLHPTMKPVSLLRKIILNSTNIGDCVCDVFGGSGSLLIAAEQTKRKCLMVEIDPDYCNVIIDRFERLTNIKAKRVT